MLVEAYNLGENLKKAPWTVPFIVLTKLLPVISIEYVILQVHLKRNTKKMRLMPTFDILTP